MMKPSVISSLLGLMYLATMAAGQYAYQVHIGITSDMDEWYTTDTVCMQRQLKGKFVGRMSCRADRIDARDYTFKLDAGPTELTHDPDDYIVITQSGSDALFIDSLWVVSLKKTYAKYLDLKEPSTFNKLWGIRTNQYGWCLSTDEHDDTWKIGRTGKCHKTLLFAMNHQVYYYVTNPRDLCIRPRWGCEHSDEVYHADTDCDGDGLTDHTCHDKTGNYWIVKSSNGRCTGNDYHGGGNWEHSTYDACPGAFSRMSMDKVNQGRAGWGPGRRIEGQPALAPVEGEAVVALVEEAQNSVLGRLLKATQAPGGTPTPAVSTPQAAQAPQSDRQLEEAVLVEEEQFENL